MKSYLKLFLFFILVSLSHAVNITCKFKDHSFTGSYISVYSYFVADNPRIYNEHEQAEIIEIDKDNKLCEGFIAQNMDIHYIPNGIAEQIIKLNRIATKIPELKGLQITNSNLKEISQENLKNFTELMHLDLSENEIEFLEADLFKYNTKIVNIVLNDNKISTIEPNSFNANIETFKLLGMVNNLCIKESVTDRTSVKKLINETLKKCWTESSQAQMKMFKMERNARRKSKENAKQLKIYKREIQEMSKDTQQIQQNFLKLNETVTQLIAHCRGDVESLSKSINDSTSAIESFKAEIIQKLSEMNIDDKLDQQNSNISILASNVQDLFNKTSELQETLSEKIENSKGLLEKKLQTAFNDTTQHLDTKFDEVTQEQKTQGDSIEHIKQQIQNIEKNPVKLEDFQELLENLQNSTQIKPQPIIQQSSASSTSFIDYLNTALLVIITSIIIIMICIQRQSKVTQNSQNNAIVRFDDVTSTYNDLNIRESSVPIPYQESMDDNDYQYTQPYKVQRQTICETQNVHNQIYEAPEGLKQLDEELYAEVVSPNSRPKTEVFNGTDDMALYAVVNKNR